MIKTKNNIKEGDRRKTERESDRIIKTKNYIREGDRRKKQSKT